ncbi:MAG: histidine kinase dimerization/phosphoacceptor domain -containing protein [Marinoscillum sp.]
MKLKLPFISLLIGLMFDAYSQENKVDELISSGNAIVHENPDSAASIFNSVILIAYDSLVLVRGLNGLGNALQFQSEYDSAISTYLRGLGIAKRNHFSREEATLQNNLGSLYFTYGRYEEAEKYLNKALPTFESLQDTIWLTRTIINLAGVDYMNADFEASLSKLKRAAKMSSATNNLQSEGGTYCNIASVYESINKLDSAIIYIDKGINILKKLNDKRSIVMSLDMKGRIYTSLHNYAMAKIVYANRLALSKEIGYTQGVYLTYESLSRIEKLLGDNDAAYEALELAMTWKDSVLNEKNLSKINELEIKYESQRKDAEIRLLTQENQIKASQRNIMIIFIVAVSVILVLTIILFVQKQKANKILTSKNEIISNSLAEREILLQEVHHRVKNNLQVVSSLLNIQGKFLKDKNAKKAIIEGRNRVQSIAMIHQRLYKNDDLSKIDLKGYLDELSKSLFESYKVDQDEITLQTNIESLDLDLETSIQIGLIVNELISNSLKHAFSKSSEGIIQLSLSQQANKYQLVVSDNGSGIDDEAQLLSSYGFRIVKSLIRGLSAEMKLNFDHGTSITINF